MGGAVPMTSADACAGPAHLRPASPPCRDEAEYMRRTLDSVIAQTVAPRCGSSSTTAPPTRRRRSSPSTPRRALDRASSAAPTAARAQRRPRRDRRLLRGLDADRPVATSTTSASSTSTSTCRRATSSSSWSGWRPSRASAPAAASRTSTRDGDALVSESVRRRELRRHDEVLPHAPASADRRVRARGDVGRHRLPPLPAARLDRGQLGRPRAALRAPAADGHEPESICVGRLRHGAGQYFMGTGRSTWRRARFTGWRIPRTSPGASRCSWASSAPGRDGRRSIRIRTFAPSSAPTSVARSSSARPAPWPRSRQSVPIFSTPSRDARA